MKTEMQNIKAEYDFLVDEFTGENRELLEDINTIALFIGRNIITSCIDFEITIEVIVALHNFDSKNANTEYSEELRLSIIDHEPCSLFERVHELCLFVSARKGVRSRWVISSILALHYNRIVYKNFNAIPLINEVNVDDERRKQELIQMLRDMEESN